MYRIIKIGMDVHTSSFTLCAIEPVIGAEDRLLATVKTSADIKNVLMLIFDLKQKLGAADEYDIECGYEAGCLGYSIYNQLTSAGVKCTILAPSTMMTPKGKRIKTDARDALTIAQCLAYGCYHSVYVPSEGDNSVKEYMRMRMDHKTTLKKIKQQIIAFCMRHGHHYPGNYWTQKHIIWLRRLDLQEMYRETLDEYLASYDEYVAKIERYDKRIEEIAAQEEYQEKVKKLTCFLGIKTQTALSLIVETGDFNRFPKGNIYAAYLGLAPGEHSSGEEINRTRISKNGNSNLRTLLVESAQGISKGCVGQKSKALKARQAGNPANVIAYADKANIRMRRKYYRMIRNGKKHNVAATAIARELACFVWGMMTDNIA